MTDNYPIL